MIIYNANDLVQPQIGPVLFLLKVLDSSTYFLQALAVMAQFRFRGGLCHTWPHPCIKAQQTSDYYIIFLIIALKVVFTFVILIISDIVIFWSLSYWFIQFLWYVADWVDSAP